MRTHESHDLVLPPGAVANASFPYEPRLDAARRFLAARGIAEVRPLYRRRAAPAGLPEPAWHAPTVLHSAANDAAARRDDPPRDATAA